MNKRITLLLLFLVGVATIATKLSNDKEENPRGIYKLMTLVGKRGEVAAPYEQYKICTDSVTLHCSVNGREFYIVKNDKEIFNFTGKNPKTPRDKSPLIYDSDSKQFTLKWWSQYSNHIHFPNNDWCIEKYRSDEYSKYARPFFDAITNVPQTDSQNPFIGTWRMLSQVDHIDEDTPHTIGHESWHPSYVIFTPQHIVMTSKGYGLLIDALYSDTNAIIYGTTIRQVKWLSKNPDCIAIAHSPQDGETRYEILKRVDDEETVLHKIAALVSGVGNVGAASDN